MEDEALRRALAGLLLARGWEVAEAADGGSALRALQKGKPDLVIAGPHRAGDLEGLDLARQVHRRDRRIPVILVARNSSEDLAIAALRAGVADYFKLPVPLEELAESAGRCLAGLAPSDSPARRVTPGPPAADDGRIVGDSPAMREMKAYIGQVATMDTNVLITGETGTGKELVAGLIHRSSPRSAQPFVCINCAGIPDALLESELFGHERGAFTGAHAAKDGLLKMADGGSAFLDEIGDMSPQAQAKILRALETRHVYRVGGRASISLDVRIIAATNQDLERLVAENTFRKDLYFRLNVARIHLPPLRDRREDIPPLFDHYIRDLNRRFGRDVEGLTEEALARLLRYDWPGNVRELRNLLEAVFVKLVSPRILLSDLPEQVQRRLKDADDLPQSERDRLLSALLSTRWNKSKAAQQLHWSRMTLYRKMAKYHLAAEPAAGDLPPRHVTRPGSL
jgi:DNA-binding NtrC family response regulator